MAEFKLGRIRFVWQGEWATGTSYVVDDVVRNGGKSYICTVSHTASSLFVDDYNINDEISKWNLVSDGLSWQGEWDTDTYYSVGDQVKYGGNVYVANEAHTSAATTNLGLEDDSEKWDLIASSFYWTGNWATSTRYRENDFVVYGGITYFCNTAHTSTSVAADGLEDDQSSWTAFNEGFVYLGEWTDEVRYKVNDIVKYGSGTWICTTAHTSDTSFDDTKWDVFVEGLEFESSWDNATVYQIGDVVTYGGYSYIAKRNNTGSNPSTGVSAGLDWAVYTTGFNFNGDWISSTTYKVGDVVRLGGYTYLAIADSTNHTPPNPTYWSRLNYGTKWTNVEETYTAVSGTTLTGIGSSATFDITRSGTVYSVEVNSGGSNYADDDTIRILGTSVGGISPANDIVITVDTQSSGVITAVTSAGYAVTWTDGTAYVEGDIVFFGASSYICVSAHTADVGVNRPDVDTAAEYWNLFAAGSESAVLTVQGDTYYYSENGPARLPVGTDGQILRVTEGYPSWAYYGVINNVVYVAPTGTDDREAGRGLSIDKPWRTVRYAATQIDRGYRNPNAAELLKKNKQFLMKEISNWVTATYAVAITSSASATNYFTATDTGMLVANMPIEFDGTTGGVTAGTKYFVKEVISSTEFTISTTQGGSVFALSDSSTDMTGSLSYDYDFCQRDVGLLVDALAYDLTHGGNEESTKAAKAYYTTAGSDYINSNFGQQIVQTIAAYDYLKTLVSNVLNNVPPAVNYQQLNGTSTEAVQIIDSSLVAEEGTVTDATALLTIVTDGINAGVASAIPAAIYSNTTIFVKTGTYYEVLPIIIPKNTAVVGDELRSTVISPKPAIANLVNDEEKTISALNRIKTVLPNLLANNQIVVSADNAEEQQYVFNNYESIAASSVRTNIATAKTILEEGLGAVPAFTLTDPANYDTGYFNARRLLIANKDFLVAEISAWINVQISGSTSPFNGFTYGGAQQTACERDVGYIVDALTHDLTYGGNLATQIAARSYYSQGVFVETGEKAQALAVQTYLKSIIDNIATATSFTKSAGNAETQDTSGTAGSSDAGIFAQARIQEMYDCINTGTTPTTIIPSTSWVSSRKVAAHTTIQTAKTSIQTRAIEWVTTNYPLLDFNQDLCSRDVGLIVDGLTYDMMFGSDFLTIWSAMSYYRGLTSTETVIADQLDATLGIMTFIGNAVLEASAGTSTVTQNLNTMTTIIGNGLSSVPTFILPTPTAGTGNAYDAGYYNAARLISLNKQFLKDEVTAWINAQSGGIWTGFVYDQTSCERDVGYIVDALVYDLTYGGNLATVIAARSYYSNGVLVETGEEDQAKAVQLRIKDIIDNIATGNTAGWTKTTSSSQVTTGTAGSSGAAAFAQARIQEIHDTIDTGTSPTTTAPSTTWVSSSLTTISTNIQTAKTRIQAAVIQWINTTYPGLVYDATLCSRDVGYIVDALCYDLMFGSNFLSSWNAMSYYRGLTSTGVVLAQQLQQTLGTIGIVGGLVKEIESGLTGTVGNVVAATRIELSADTAYDIINNGIAGAPSEIITDPSNLDSNFYNARAQIAQNYDFIKADVSQYIQNNYASIWTALGATGQAACERDVGYILDAIRYDLTYGGNTQSLIAGRAYYSGIDLTFDSTELTATLAAYNHLKTFIDNIALNSAYTAQAGNSTPRVTTGSGGNSTAAAFAQARVQDIIDWITNGESPAEIAPNTDWVDPALVLGWTTLQARKTEIQNDSLGYVQKFHQALDYDQTTCARDVGYMVDGFGYDMMFNSNFAAITIGRSYHRALSSTQVVLATQKDASLGIVKFLKYKLKGYAVGGAVAKAATVIDDIIGTIDGGAVPRFLWPSFTGVDAENYAAAKLIWENKKFIEAETLAYINDNYPAIEYSHETCARDVGYIVDAIRYDLTYGGNFATRQAAISYYSQLTDALQIDAADKTATLAAYDNLKTLVEDIANGGLSTYSALQTNVSYITGSSGDSTSATTVGTLIQDMIDYIDDRVANPITETLPSTSWVSTTLVTQSNALNSAKSTIVDSVTTYIGTNYPNLEYESTTCERDVGYIIDALRYDLMLGTNFRSVKAGMSYYQAQASAVIGDQKRATLNAYRFLKDEVKDVVSSDATSLASVNANMTAIINILDKGVGETPDVVGSVTYFNNVANANAVEVLRANTTFLENEATAWIKQNFGGSVTGTTSAGSIITTADSHNLTVGDPVKFTATVVSTSATAVTSTGNLITVLTTDGMVVGSKITFTGAGVGNIVSGTTYFIKTIPSVTTITISETFDGTVFNPGTASGVLSVTAGAIIGGLEANTQYYVLTVPSTTTFTVSVSADSITPKTLTTDTGTMTAVYSFDEASCKRDMREYVLALIEDLSLPGNYKATLAANLYRNAVSGSEMSDMFHVSNATGLRNCTLSGLVGDLTELNDYGTRRPTGGSFVALNPGFGPYDSRVWVTSRSHYSQNVTMFGSGVTGAKIDAALHRYGNKSMVKNDFTTIISDGIGVWCTGQDSLTELVSVFNYYGYSGYLAELGGRIRATNGNSSYGTYGVIAEGVDVHETPIYGTVDNQANQAQITETVTDGVTQVLRMEFGNAGTGYTNISYTVDGAGYNVDVIGDEFRDGAVYETRIIDLDDDNGVGGTSYVTQSNAAQSGDATTITIAATDTALTNSYNGMRIQLTAGTGAGQYANILTYGGGSKIASVWKDSFAPLTVSTTTDTGDYINVASNEQLYVNMPIYFVGTTFGGVSENTLYYVKALNGTTQFTISTSVGGSAENVTTGSGTMYVYAAGWDHAVPGTEIESALDLTTQYIIEPRISFTAPGYTATGVSMGDFNRKSGMTYGDGKFIAISDASTATRYSEDGETWSSAGALAGTGYYDVVYGGGHSASATVVIGGLGGQGAVFEAVLGVENTTGAATDDQVASVTVIDGGQGYTTPPVIVFTPVSGGTGAVATCAVLDGAVVSVTVTVPGSGYNVAPTVSAATDRVTSVTVNAWGNGYTSTPTVTVDDPFTGSAWSSGGTVTTGDYIYYVNSGDKNWYYVSTGGTFTTTGPIHTSGSAVNGTVTLLYVGTRAVLTPTLLNEGVSEYAITDAGAGYTTVPNITIVDTSARYVAVDTAGNSCYTTSAGIAAGSAWTAGTAMSGSPTIQGLAYGGGVYVTVGSTASAYSSTNGSTWTSRTIPTLGAGMWRDVAYGNGTFVAISSSNLETAISSNGTSWSAGGNLPASGNWLSIAYGNGRFVAVAQSGTSRIAISYDKGATWVYAPAALPSGSWMDITYGQGLFVIVSQTSGYAVTSPDGITWTLQSLPNTSQWRSVTFGNPDNRPLFIAGSYDSGNTAAVIRTGAKATGRVKVTSDVVSEIRMVEPGSGYPYGTVSDTTVTTNLITVDNTVNLVDSQPIEFFGTDAGGLTVGTTYYVIGSTITSTQFKVSATAGSSTAVTLSTATVSGMTYRAGPIVTITDPNKVKTVATRVRLGDGALGNPSFYNRGTDMATATTEPIGDGYSDLYQPSSFINVAGLYDIPEAGANVEFASLPGVYFKLVSVINELGSLGNKTATLQINPALTVLQAPKHGDLITTRLKYSQVRLTGHDFLYIGTGGKEATNYPNVDISTAIQANQTVYSAGGRVFFTSTDQDGNFNVGNLFGVQQATGTATLNASAFNLSGLNSLQLGAVELGIGSAIITQFSTDPFFTADSDSVVPTQRAIKAYITAQIGGGQSSLNVNTLTSGIVYIAGNSISTTTGEAINVTSKMNFTGGIDGAPVALGFFMQR